MFPQFITMLSASTIYCDETSRVVVGCVVRDTGSDQYMRCLKSSRFLSLESWNIAHKRLLYPEERNQAFVVRTCDRLVQDDLTSMI